MLSNPSSMIWTLNDWIRINIKHLRLKFIVLYCRHLFHFISHQLPVLLRGLFIVSSVLQEIGGIKYCNGAAIKTVLKWLEWLELASSPPIKGFSTVPQSRKMYLNHRGLTLHLQTQVPAGGRRKKIQRHLAFFCASNGYRKRNEFYKRKNL